MPQLSFYTTLPIVPNSYTTLLTLPDSYTTLLIVGLYHGVGNPSRRRRKFPVAGLRLGQVGHVGAAGLVHPERLSAAELGLQVVQNLLGEDERQADEESLQRVHHHKTVRQHLHENQQEAYYYFNFGCSHIHSRARISLAETRQSVK